MSKRKKPKVAEAVSATGVAELEALYAAIPAMECQGLCAHSCGPVNGSPVELARVRERGIDLLAVGSDLTCPALNRTFGPGRCSVYEVRPMVCFTPDTLIYTPRGAQPIGELLAGDLVYDGNGQRRRIIATASRWHDGEVVDVRFSATGPSARCTPDHQWLVTQNRDKRSAISTHWARADDLVIKRHGQPGHYTRFPRRWEDVSDLQTLHTSEFVSGRLSEDGHRLHTHTGTAPQGRTPRSVPACWPVDDDFLFMLGLYLAEGSSTYQSSDFTLNAEATEDADRLIAYLGRQNVSFVDRSRDNSRIVHVDSSIFAQLMRSLAGRYAPEKVVNGSLWARLSHRQRWEVYLGWDRGDGRRGMPERQLSTTTSSSRLAGQMMLAALGHGLFPRTYITRPKGRGLASLSVNLFASNWREAKSGHGTRLRYDEDGVYSPVGSLDRTEYSGPVVDIQVEGSESFVTASGTAHNCRLWGVAASMPCPHGCIPQGSHLDDDTAMRLMAASIAVGGPSASPVQGLLDLIGDDPQAKALMGSLMRGDRSVKPELGERIKALRASVFRGRPQGLDERLEDEVSRPHRP